MLSIRIRLVGKQYEKRLAEKQTYEDRMVIRLPEILAVYF